jgi:hypothetical protein
MRSINSMHISCHRQNLPRRFLTLGFDIRLCHLALALGLDSLGFSTFDANAVTPAAPFLTVRDAGAVGNGRNR